MDLRMTCRVGAAVAAAVGLTIVALFFSFFAFWVYAETVGRLPLGDILSLPLELAMAVICFFAPSVSAYLAAEWIAAEQKESVATVALLLIAVVFGARLVGFILHEVSGRVLDLPAVITIAATPFGALYFLTSLKLGQWLERGAS